MSNYTKFLSRFWTGSTGRAFRGHPITQLTAAYLITSPHANMIGFYYMPVSYLAADIGLPIEGASEALRSLIEAEFCHYDPENEILWVSEMARFQVGETLEHNDKRAKFVSRLYAELPNNLMLKAFHDRYGVPFHIAKARTYEAPRKGLARTTEASSSTSTSNSSREEKSSATPTRQPTLLPLQVVAKSRAAQFSSLLIELKVKPNSKEQRAWADASVTDDEVREALRIARIERGLAQPSAAYLTPIIEDQRQPKRSAGTISNGRPWYVDWPGLQGKAREFGIEEKSYDNPQEFRAAVLKAGGITREEADRVSRDYEQTRMAARR